MVSTHFKNFSQIGSSPQVGEKKKKNIPWGFLTNSVLPDVYGSFDSPALRASFFFQIRRSPQGTTKPCFLFAWKGACFCDDGAGQRVFWDVVWMMEFTRSKDLHKTNKLISMTHLKHIYKTCYNACAHIWYVYTLSYLHTLYKQKSFNKPYTHNHKHQIEYIEWWITSTSVFLKFLEVNWVSLCRIIDINPILGKPCAFLIKYRRYK